MPLPTLTGVARLVADPELRFTQAGKAMARLRLVFQNRRKNERGDWEDGDVLWINGTAFGPLAEHIAESLEKGMEVTVSGRPRTEQWTDKQTQEKRTAVALVIDQIGPSLAFAIARVSRPERDGNGSQAGAQQAPRPQQTQRQQPQADPWAMDQPPF
ncbi:single-stranded DNA-binding protein [Phaeacidiphilus oryzae]|uniref:single-stranded DNA-binding protein n=1 Tax=Phaeacidiphilus oryzae TaxID=348818 RepID=UPI00068F0F5C|nr:single-stranded DNA-binding protein [Phaeacidiphilus oryzae]